MKSSPFQHIALEIGGKSPLVYTAMSKHLFYFRMHISKFVLDHHKVPLNPFMLFDYFLLDTIDRNHVREANNSLVCRADELWVFGPISNGVLAEIKIAQRQQKPISYFSILRPHEIVPISPEEVEMENEVASFRCEIERS